MNFEQLKQKAKDELIKVIREKSALIERLQADFDNLDKFKIGNVIEDDSRYFLIVGDPRVDGEYLKIPIRHNVYPIIRIVDCSMNMSGAIDLVKIPIAKTTEVKIMTVKEMFNSNKTKLKENISSKIRNNKERIEMCQKKIQDAIAEINALEKTLKETEEFDFDANFDSYIDKYLESEDYKKYVLNTHQSDISYDDNRYTFKIKCD